MFSSDLIYSAVRADRVPKIDRPLSLLLALGTAFLGVVCSWRV